jgi:hypothetical protein
MDGQGSASDAEIRARLAAGMKGVSPDDRAGAELEAGRRLGLRKELAPRASRELEKAFARLGRGRLMAAERFLIDRLLKT